MSGKFQHYLAIGEEAARGTPEKTTVGFVPIDAPFMPQPEFNDVPRTEYRGEDRGKGANLVRRFDQKWAGTVEMPLFTEGGTVSGIVGTMLKHFFGAVTTAQNGSTGQYAHMFYPETAPFDTGNALAAKALTLNSNFSKGATIYNHAYTGARFSKITITQEQGAIAKATFDAFGQYLDTESALISTPAFAAENLSLRPSNLMVYNGAGATKTGTPPDYTDLAPNTMNAFSPETITLEIENGRADELRFDGADYPSKTVTTEFKYTLNFKIDWEVPSAGFDSTAEWIAWYTAIGSTPFMLVWDTGTQAGTGDNHSLIIDVPVANRVQPDFDLDQIGAKKIDLKYEGLVDLTTTTYGMGALLKNTADAV